MKQVMLLLKNLLDGEYKNILLNNKHLRHLMNRAQNKNHKIGTYKKQ